VSLLEPWPGRWDSEAPWAAGRPSVVADSHSEHKVENTVAGYRVEDMVAVVADTVVVDREMAVDMDIVVVGMRTVADTGLQAHS